MHLINGSPTNATQACMHDRTHVMLGEGTLCWRLFPAGNDKFRGCLIDTIRNGPRIHRTFVRLDLGKRDYSKVGKEYGFLKPTRASGVVLVHVGLQGHLEINFLLLNNGF